MSSMIHFLLELLPVAFFHTAHVPRHVPRATCLVDYVAWSPTGKKNKTLRAGQTR